MRLVAGKQTDAGRVREGNEDGFVVNDGIGLFAVADGMGGHQAGEVASATALEALRSEILNGVPVRDAISRANEAVIERAAVDPNLRGMGTTLTAGTLAAGNTFLVGHVGDSRAYLFRDGELSQVTDDHSLVEELVREGELTPEQAEVHPRRSVITRALGIESDVEVDIYTLDLREGDRVLLCSDGLTGMVRTEDIAGILRREPDPQRAANQLVDAANAAGGEDNITAVVVDAVDDGQAPAVTAAEADGAGGASEAEAVDDEEPVPTPVPARRRRGAGGVGRVLMWVVPIVVVLALAFGAVGWYARRTYFVEITAGRVTVFKGVPGGLLGWDPTLEERTSVRAADLTPAERSDLEGGKRFSSRESADRYVNRLEDNAEERTAATSTTTSTTTTTTIPPAPAPPAP